MLDNEARIRRWTAKTRTGCRTCRIRRIKCDETRPNCSKCLKSGRQCEGYEVPQGNPAKSSPTVILPRIATTSEPGLKYLAPYELSRTLDPVERKSFDFFRSHAATSLSGHFSSTVFQYLVLQVTHKQPVVLQAAVAVGSIYRARVMAAQLSFATINDCPYYNSALKQYNKAISSLSDFINTQADKDQVERLIVVLITCLLFVCFEMLHGDQAIVISHLVNGLKVLFERTTPRDSICTNKRILTIGRADSDVIDTVSQVFVRLDADSTMFGRRIRAPYLCPRSFGRFLGPDLDLPPAFASLEEARAHLDTLTSITFGFRGELLKLVDQDLPSSSDDQTDWPRHYCMLHAAVRCLELESNPEVAGKKDKILAAFDSWSKSLSKLDQNTRRQGLLMLKIQKFYPWFIMVTLQDIRATLCDRYQEDFESILDMVSEYISINCAECPGFSFALEPGITASLYLVGIKCRDPTIRRRVIETLAKMKVQEGMWSRRSFATYCQRFMDLEERRAKQVLQIDGAVAYIPEEARFNDVVFGMDPEAPGVGRLICARRAVEDRDGLEIVEDRFNIEM